MSGHVPRRGDAGPGAGVDGDDDAVVTPAFGGAVVVLDDEGGDGGRRLLGEGGAVGHRGEPHLAVEGEGRDPLTRLGRAGGRLADVAYEAGGDGEQPARGEPVG